MGIFFYKLDLNLNCYRVPVNKDITVSDCVQFHIMNGAVSECSVGERPNNLILLHCEELLVSKCDPI
jgi:hypothetical protein